MSNESAPINATDNDNLDLTSDELDLVLGGNGPSGAQMSFMDHVTHVATFVGIGGSIAGPPGAITGLGAGLAYEAYEHRAEISQAASQTYDAASQAYGNSGLPEAFQSYQDNPPPI